MKASEAQIPFSDSDRNPYQRSGTEGMTKSHSDDRHDQAPSAMQIGTRYHGVVSGLEFTALSLAEANHKWGRTGQLRLDVWVMQLNSEFEHVPIPETQEQLAATSERCCKKYPLILYSTQRETGS